MYIYTSLPEGSVRILRLLPSSNQESRIECQLITFILDSEEAHPYEALSYVWGSEDGKKPIYIKSNDNNDSNKLRITANLHAALSHLRHRFWERFLWIDAICINQGDTDEKNQQVQSMAKIYAKASRVIVWLGDAADKGDQALEAIRKAAQEQYTDSAIYEPNHQATLALSHQDLTNSSNNEANQAILRLLQRPWFQRIWVLQEVAAARHVLIKCGSREIEGYAFCSGMDALKHYQSSPELSSLIRSVAYLIRGAGFRPRFENGPAGRFSLNIRPLSELVDMYHDRKATDRRDKVYALLGMSLDGPNAAELSANYETSWKDVFQKLIRVCLSDKVSVSTWDKKEVAVVEVKGYALGTIASATEDARQNGKQHVEITWKRAPSHSDRNGEQPSRFTFQASAKTIKKGDVVCLLEGASTPTIIRLCDGFSTIIIITFPRTNDLPKWIASIARFPTDFLLVWDWGGFRKSQGGKDYGNFISSRGVPKCSRAGCECQNRLDEAARWWNLGVLLNGLERYEEAVKHFRKAMEVYGIGAALRSVGNTYLEHGRCKEEDERALGIMEELCIDDKGAIEAGYKEHGYTPLHWAAEKGREAVARLLAELGADKEAKDRGGCTPLHLAVWNGHEAVARLLAELGADKEAQNGNGWTPLHVAVKKGHDTVARLLAELGADKEAKDRSGCTPLHLAAKKGYEAVVKLLADLGADKEAKDRGGCTPLHFAAQNKHEMVTKLLAELGADKEAKNCDGWTPLHFAAQNKHEAVAKLLAELGADKEAKDRGGCTPLHLAAKKGHETIAKLLAELGADKEAQNGNGWTPLHFAAWYGHKAVIKLLAELGADKEVKDRDGCTPLHLTAQNKCEAVTRLLAELGADKEAKDRGGCTPLHLAAWNGHETVIKLLAELGADKEAKDRDGWTPLRLAAEKGHEAVVRLLADLGADKAKDRDGRTPLHWAAWNGHEAAWDKSARTELERMNSEYRDMKCRYEAMEKAMQDIRESLKRSKGLLVEQEATSWNPFRRR